MAKRGGGNTISAIGRRQDPAGRLVHRRLPRRREEVRPGHEGADRLLAGLHRPGQVQGGGAEPDRGRLARSSSRVAGPCGLGALDGGEGGGRLGRRRRRRPVVPRPAHPDERGEARRPRASSASSRRVQDGTLSRRHDFVFNLKNGGVALGKISPKVPKAYIAQDQRARRSRSSPARSSRRRPSRGRSESRRGGRAARPALSRDRIAALMAEPPVLELRGITKQFPGVLANDHVDFELCDAARCTRCSARTAPASRR